MTRKFPLEINAHTHTILRSKGPLPIEVDPLGIKCTPTPAELDPSSQDQNAPLVQ